MTNRYLEKIASNFVDMNAAGGVKGVGPNQTWEKAFAGAKDVSPKSFGEKLRGAMSRLPRYSALDMGVNSIIGIGHGDKKHKLQSAAAGAAGGYAGQVAAKSLLRNAGPGARVLGEIAGNFGGAIAGGKAVKAIHSKKK